MGYPKDWESLSGRMLSHEPNDLLVANEHAAGRASGLPLTRRQMGLGVLAVGFVAGIAGRARAEQTGRLTADSNMITVDATSVHADED